MKKYVGRTLAAACVYFTVLTFVYAAVVYIQYNTAADGGLVSSYRLIMMFFFSLAFAAARALLHGDKSSRFIMTALHALLTGAAFFFFMILPADIDGPTAFAGMFIYYAAYILVALISRATSRRFKMNKARKTEYMSVFSKEE